jgi:amidase
VHVRLSGTAKPAEYAFRIALVDLLRWLVESYGFSLSEAYLLLGQVLKARRTPFVNPSYTYVAKLEKKYLKA